MLFGEGPMNFRNRTRRDVHGAPDYSGIRCKVRKFEADLTVSNIRRQMREEPSHSGRSSSRYLT